MNNDELQKVLQEGSLPEPLGGHETSRERLMGKVRHQFPVEAIPHKRSPRLYRSLLTGTVIAALALVGFLAWPEPSAEADPLPSEAQMQQFYDQHKTHHTEHLQESLRLP